MTLFPADPGAEAFFALAARAAAETIGLYRALPGDATSLAERTGTGPRRLAALLDALCLDGTLRRDGTGFTLGTLPPPAPPIPAQAWGRLAEVLRSDRPLELPDESPAFHEHLQRANAGPARRLWERVPVVGPLLDLGGGIGTFTAPFLHAHPDATATLVDRAGVCALAAPLLAGFGDRARLVAGDLLSTTPGGGFGAVLLANVLHLYPPVTCRDLLRRAAAALAPRGTLIVVEIAIAADRSGPPAAVYFALNMALYTDGGTVHDAGTLATWMGEATRGATTAMDLDTPELILITSCLPAALPSPTDRS